MPEANMTCFYLYNAEVENEVVFQNLLRIR